MNRYGHPFDHVAVVLAVAGVLLMAFTLPSIRWGLIATACIVIAGAILLWRLYRW